VLNGTDITLDMVDSPTFVGMRQRDFNADISVEINVESGEGGISMYMTENEHYEVAVRECESGFEAVLKLNIGGIKHIQKSVPLKSGSAVLKIAASNFAYGFGVVEDGEYTELGCGLTKYLSSEVAEGFTGVVMGLYAVNGVSGFRSFSCQYK